MPLETSAFVHDYKPSELNYGRGSIGRISDILDDRDLDDVLVVCGTTVGTNDALMDPLREGLDGRIAGVFAETTPEKRLQTMFEGVERVAETDTDALVAVGGGSSIDVAKGISAFAMADRSYNDAFSEVVNTGELTLPRTDHFLPLLAVPTTLAGAELSIAAGVVADTEDGPVEPVLVDNRLMPTSLVHDPASSRRHRWTFSLALQ